MCAAGIRFRQLCQRGAFPMDGGAAIAAERIEGEAVFVAIDCCAQFLNESFALAIRHPALKHTELGTQAIPAHHLDKTPTAPVIHDIEDHHYTASFRRKEFALGHGQCTRQGL